MKSKNSSNALNLLIVAAIIGVINYIVGGLGIANFRGDLTEKRIFTLSEGTKHIIEGLNPSKPFTIRFYASRDNRIMPQQLQGYAGTVQDLLLQFEKVSGGKIKLEKIDPRPNTEDEDRATADDIQGYPVNQQGEKFYLGIAIECPPQKEIIPTLNPNDEANLEYQLARAIAKVSKTKKQVVGVMSPMPINSPQFNFPMQQQRQQPPWVVIQQLQQDYEVRDVAISSDKIDPAINVLLIVHPYNISEKTEFAIDQFVLQGGKVIAFVDPHCLVSKAYDNPGQPGMMPTVTTLPTSDLPHLLPAWGVNFDKGKMVADVTYATDMGRGNAIPTFVTVDHDGINGSEPITSSLEVIQLFGVGSFSLDKKDGVTYTTLLQSSENSELIDTTLADEVQRTGLKTFNPDGKKKILALRLSGKLKTAFPDGPPKEKNPAQGMPNLPGEQGGEDKKDAGAPAAVADKKDPAAAPSESADKKKDEAPPSLKEGDGKGIVCLFADADMEYDAFALETDQRGRPLPVAANSNIPMLLNIVEMLSGGSELINVRSRGLTKRPFTKMRELQAKVEAKYRPMVEQEQKELQKVVDEITTKGGAQAEAKSSGIIRINAADLKNLRERQVQIQKHIRSYQKDQNREKDHKEMLIIALNLLTVPLVLVALGIGLAIWRSSLRAAH